METEVEGDFTAFDEEYPEPTKLELMLEIGLRPFAMWELAKNNFPTAESSGIKMHVEMDKVSRWLRVPISKRAQEIIAAHTYRFSPWADATWCIEDGELWQRTQVRNEIRRCYGGKRDTANPDTEYEPSISLTGDGCLKRGRAICRPKGIRLHRLRHTFAMLKLAAGCPLEVIKDLLGHKSVAMAEIYASQLPKTALAKWV